MYLNRYSVDVYSLCKQLQHQQNRLQTTVAKGIIYCRYLIIIYGFYWSKGHTDIIFIRIFQRFRSGIFRI